MNETDEGVRALLERFEPRTIEPPEWEDVLARLERPDALPASRPARGGGRRWRHGRRLALAVIAVLAVTVAVALGVTAPWRGGPTILERASAAIQSPSRTQVLYMSYVEKRSGCCRPLGALSVRLWVQGSAPRHFRAVFPGVESPLDEGGGTMSPTSILTLFRYDRRRNILEPLNTGSHVSTGEFDPVAIVREALAGGRARVDGKAAIGGKRVIRIRLTARDRQNVVGRVIYYVDPKTYEPIGIDYPRLAELRFPFEPLFGNGIYKLTIRFFAFDYLPATPENVKLANIRAMHPTAKVR